MKTSANQIRLNESELRDLISEQVRTALNEVFSSQEGADVDEGFFQNLSQAWKGAKQGYNYQKAMDRGTQGFKQEHDYEDVKRTMNNPLSKMPNTASEQANQLYQQAAEYQAMANKLKARANAISKQYGLAKTGVGQRANANPVPQSPGIPAFTQGQGNPFTGGARRYVPQNVGTPLTLEQ